MGRLLIPIAAVSLAAAALAAHAEPPADGGVAAPPPSKPAEPSAEKWVGPGDLTLVENKTTYFDAAGQLYRLGVRNIKVHPGDANASHIISADGLEFLPVFSLFGYMGKIDMGAHLVQGARPKNYDVMILGGGLIMVTAENFVLKFPNNMIKFVYLACRMEGKDAVADMHEVLSSIIRKHNGFYSPRFHRGMDGEYIYLHAKDENGKDWPEAYALDPETGAPKKWVKWEDVRRMLR